MNGLAMMYLFIMNPMNIQVYPKCTEEAHIGDVRRRARYISSNPASTYYI